MRFTTTMKITSLLVPSLLAGGFLAQAAEEKIAVHKLTEQWEPEPVIVSAPADAPPVDCRHSFRRH